jgi:4-hydroxy-3-methylbut-2-enyl diphosphate reductase
MGERTSPDVLLAQPRGFCAGVTRAIEMARLALQRHGAPVYLFKEIVHNAQVIDEITAQGGIFVQRIEDIPLGAVTIFSAHGVPPTIVAAAHARRLRIVDTTCPLVHDVQRQAERYSRLGHNLLVIGRAGHEEIEGICGAISGPHFVIGSRDDIDALPLTAAAKVAYVTQTTLSMEDTRELIAALEQRFPLLEGQGLGDICFATRNRQRAVRHLAARVDLVIVVGTRNSSNTLRLLEVAADQGVPARLVESAEDLQVQWWQDVQRIGVSAGASTPEHVIREVCARLQELGIGVVRELPGLVETRRFAVDRTAETATSIATA